MEGDVSPPVVARRKNKTSKKAKSLHQEDRENRKEEAAGRKESRCYGVKKGRKRNPEFSLNRGAQ